MVNTRKHLRVFAFSLPEVRSETLRDRVTIVQFDIWALQLYIEE